MALTLKYSGSEALQMVRDTFPNWKEKIDEGKAKLFRIKKMYNKELVASYQHYLNVGCSPESSIVMLASLHWILEEERSLNQDISSQVNSLLDSQDNVLNQAKANEESKTTTSIDKQMLRSFYTKKGIELQKQIDELIGKMEVNSPMILTIQTKLFS